jgi:hypothetical protein
MHPFVVTHVSWASLVGLSFAGLVQTQNRNQPECKDVIFDTTDACHGIKARLCIKSKHHFHQRCQTMTTHRLAGASGVWLLTVFHSCLPLLHRPLPIPGPGPHRAVARERSGGCGAQLFVKGTLQNERFPYS